MKVGLDCWPSLKDSEDQDFSFLTVTARNAAEVILEVTGYLEEWWFVVVPFPVIFATDPVSPASLVLLLGPESENNLPDIWN